MRQPPAVANWLVEHFVSQETLAGDLVEEFARGRSSAWYWKQVLFAILVRRFGHARDYSLLAMRAVMMGWVLVLAWIFACDLLLAPLNLGGLPGLFAWANTHGMWPAFALLPFTGYFLSGWAVGRFHRPTMVFVFLTCLLAGSLLRRFGMTPEWLPGAMQPRGWSAAVAAVAISLSALISSPSRSGTA